MIEKKCKDDSTESSEAIISNDKEFAETINKFFADIVLNVKIPASHTAMQISNDDPVQYGVFRKIINLYISKASQQRDILT